MVFRWGHTALSPVNPSSDVFTGAMPPMLILLLPLLNGYWESNNQFKEDVVNLVHQNLALVYWTMFNVARIVVVMNHRFRQCTLVC